MAAHESPVAAAIREATEEMGPFPASNAIHAHTNDHGGWAYHTVTADAPSPFEPRFDDENTEHGWFTPAEVDELPLHPGFRESWDALRPTESPAGAGLSGNSLTEKSTAWKFSVAPSVPSRSDASDVSFAFASHKISPWRISVKEKPPNLRQAWGEHRCSNCVAFRPQGSSMEQEGKCSMFDGYRVEKSEVCDDWETKKHVGGVGEWMQRRWPDVEPMVPTHRCPSCGQGLLSNAHRGWRGITDEGENVAETPGGWHCPSCDTNLANELPMDLSARIGSIKPLYHWTDAHDLDQWMDPSHTGPGETYLTEDGDPPGSGTWNADVPMPEHPVRLTIDPAKLDEKFFDPKYEGWLGNHLYMGVVPPDAIVDLKSFTKPDDWDSLDDDDSNVDPAPTDHWGDPQYHDIQFSNDGRGSP